MHVEVVKWPVFVSKYQYQYKKKIALKITDIVWFVSEYCMSTCSAISIWASDELSQVNSLLLKPSVIEEKEQNDCKQQNSNEQ